jgi:tryptophanyl-tRNA synthetase
MGPIGREMKRLMADPGYVDSVLRRGAERASAIAAPNLRAVQDMVGLLRP